MSDDAQTIQSAIQLLELGGRLTLFMGGLIKNYGFPAFKFGTRSLGKIMQVAGTLLYAQFAEKNTLSSLIEKKGNDLTYFEVNTENEDELKKIKKQLEAYNIDYAQMPDLCGGDGKTQFAFSPKDAVRFKMFLRNLDERRKDHPDLPELNIISVEDYANTGYDANDKPTPELSELMKSAEEEIKKERKAQEKEAAKTGKKVESPDLSPGPETKTYRSPDNALNAFDAVAMKDRKAREMFIADKENPGNYIRCKAIPESNNGNDYIRTEFEAYRNGNPVYKAEGRTVDGKSAHWADIKRQLKIQSGISGKCYAFDDEDSLENWQKNVSRNSDTVAFDEFAAEYEKQASPGFIKEIDAENIIKIKKDGNILVDIPEFEKSCMIIDRDSVISLDEGKLKVKFSHDKNYLVMDKASSKSAFIKTSQIESMWRMGSLNRKFQELNNQYEYMKSRSASKSKAEFAKDMTGSMENVLHSATKKRSAG